MSNRYIYYRPSWAHRNVVPYHPIVAILWGAHMNIQRINSAAWSFYVLKYAMKVGSGNTAQLACLVRMRCLLDMYLTPWGRHTQPR